MKRFILILSILSLTIVSFAQEGIIQTRPANNKTGRVLNMKETITSASLRPKDLWCQWKDSERLCLYKDNQWQIYNVVDKTYSPLSLSPEEVLMSEARKRRNDATNFDFSSNLSCAYTSGNNLYIMDKDGNEHIVAESDDENISYGQVVSRNEFGINGGTFWSEDGSKLAFYRKDESNVSRFPLLDITTRTGSLKEIRYPMAGMDSEIIQLGIYDLTTKKTIYLCVTDFDSERYLTNITWSPDNRYILIQVLDRSQKDMHLNLYDANTGNCLRTLLTEDNEKYVEPSDPLYFIKGYNDLFIYRTNNRDGFRNLYLCDLEGGIKRIIGVSADVHYIANDGKWVYYTSAEVSPIENHLFRIELKNLKGGLKKVKVTNHSRMTTAPGWHNIAMSPDCRHFTDTYSSLTVPRVIDLYKADGEVMENMLTAEDPTLDYAYTDIHLGTVKSADGKYDNYYRMIMPKDFDPLKKYPVIVYVYGGPHSQMVKNSFMAELRRWEMYMAQRGYIVYVQDNRGTENRGLEFEQAIHKQCGQVEMEDQMVGVNMLMDLPYVDKERIGVHGWSYGGFMTISLITNYPDVFRVGVAGGPVIDWKWYEVMYGERYMETPESNPEGYAKTSLINKAKDLKGKLLICQGAIDPVVVWEHSLSFVRECVKNNIQVDYFPYPCAEHNVVGKDRIHLMDKVSMYFEDYLR